MSQRALALIVLLALPLVLAGCLGEEASIPDDAPVASDGDCHRFAGTVDLQAATIPDLHAAMDAGALTSVQLVEAYLARFLAYDEAGPTLNSIQVHAGDALEQAATLDAERAAGHLRGPLHGIPVLVKDNVGTADMPTTAGSIALAENVPPMDATIAAKLREAGAVVFGKAQLSEFANWMATGMPNGYSSLGGQVVNAYTMGDPSGSSSGSGVAASMALAAAAIGTETSGSILSPSNANSVVGVKPTLGLTSRAGIIPLAPSFDVPGPMVRHVVDAAIVLGAIAGPDPRDEATAASTEHLPAAADYTAALHPGALEGVRLGYDELDAENALFASQLPVLEALGAELVPFAREGRDLVSLMEVPLIFNEFKASLNAYLATEAGPDLPVASLTEIILFNQDHPDEVQYGQDRLITSDATPGSWPLAEAAAAPTVQTARAMADSMFAENDLDALIGPNAPYTSVGAAAGYPTVTVPSGYNGERPQGLSFFGPAWSEADLLAYAYAYEQATMARQPPPAINPSLVDGVCNDRAPVDPAW